MWSHLYQDTVRTKCCKFFRSWKFPCAIWETHDPSKLLACRRRVRCKNKHTTHVWLCLFLSLHSFLAPILCRLKLKLGIPGPIRIWPSIYLLSYDPPSLPWSPVFQRVHTAPGLDLSCFSCSGALMSLRLEWTSLPMVNPCSSFKINRL